jgi:hypothetical protein
VVYFEDMKEHEFDERFDRLEKTVSKGFAGVDERFAQVTSRMEAGFAQVNSLIETLANTCAREFAMAGSTTSKKRLNPSLIAWTSRPRNATSSPSASQNLSRRFDATNFEHQHHDPGIEHSIVLFRSALLDHLVGGCQQRFRHGEAEGLGGPEVDHQFEFGWLFNRDVGDFAAAEEFDDLSGQYFCEELTVTRSVAGKAPFFSCLRKS